MIIHCGRGIYHNGGNGGGRSLVVRDGGGSSGSYGRELVSCRDEAVLPMVIAQPSSKPKPPLTAIGGFDRRTRGHYKHTITRIRAS